MKDGKQSDVVVMEFAKAFNKVSYTRLFHKLHMYGIDPIADGPGPFSVGEPSMW